MRVCGIDSSSRAVDLVLLDDNDHGEWHRLELAGETPFLRARDLRQKLPRGTFWDGVSLVGLEQTYSGAYSSATALALIRGAIGALLPAELTVLETRPNEWQKLFTGVAKLPAKSTMRKALIRGRCSELGFWAPDLPQDAYDAYGIAWAARAINQAAWDARNAA